MFPLLFPLIGAGASILGSVFNNSAQKKANQDQRSWNEKMYQLQRADALSDWNMQNDYNSPMSQMQRLRDAGLNPNLVYGKGADNTAGVVRSTNMDSWQPKAPHFDISSLGQSLASIYDIRLKEAQTDNLKAQNTVAIQDAALRAAQVAQTTANTAKTGVDTEAAKFGLSQSQRLADISAETAAQQLEKLKTDTYVALDSNERQKALASSSMAKAAEEILSLRASRANTEVERDRIRASIQNLKNDNTLKELDIQLKKLGIQPNDELWQRILGRIIGNEGVQKNLKEAYNQAGGKVGTILERWKAKQF